MQYIQTLHTDNIISSGLTITGETLFYNNLYLRRNLHLDRDLEISGNIIKNGEILEFPYQFWKRSGSSVFYPNSVGIGTSNPSGKLEIYNGSLIINNHSNNKQQLLLNGDCNLKLNSFEGTNSIVFSKNNTDYWAIQMVDNQLRLFDIVNNKEAMNTNQKTEFLRFYYNNGKTEIRMKEGNLDLSNLNGYYRFNSTRPIYLNNKQIINNFIYQLNESDLFVFEDDSEIQIEKVI